MRDQYCAAAITHPPYACTKEEQRSWLEALSLSFSIAELLYAALIFGAARLLWRRFRQENNNKVNPSKASPLNAVIVQNRTYMAPNDIEPPPTVAELLRGNEQQQINKRLAEMFIRQQEQMVRQQEQLNARLAHLEHEQGMLDMNI